MTWLYKQTERASDFGPDGHDLFTVGFYDPDGKWHAESDHRTDAGAAERVRWLNGGPVADSPKGPTLGVDSESVFDAVFEAVRDLRAKVDDRRGRIRAHVEALRTEVDCRIEHGAEGEHLKYVRTVLGEILEEPLTIDLMKPVADSVRARAIVDPYAKEYPGVPWAALEGDIVRGLRRFSGQDGYTVVRWRPDDEPEAGKVHGTLVEAEAEARRFGSTILGHWTVHPLGPALVRVIEDDGADGS